jgi:hypothetical protein
MLLQQDMEAKNPQDWNLIQPYSRKKFFERRVGLMLRFKMPVMKVAKPKKINIKK